MAWTRACSTAEVSPDQPISVDVNGTLVAIVYTEGEWFAIRDECSHRQIMLSRGEVDDCTLECVAHGARFDLRTGHPLDLPATQPVPIYPVLIEDDAVLVDLDSPIQTQES